MKTQYNAWQEEGEWLRLVDFPHQPARPLALDHLQPCFRSNGKTYALFVDLFAVVVSARLCEQDPTARLETIRLAGEIQVPYTSGILLGIGESRRERIDALLQLRDLHREYGHIQVLPLSLVSLRRTINRQLLL